MTLGRNFEPRPVICMYQTIRKPKCCIGNKQNFLLEHGRKIEHISKIFCVGKHFKDFLVGKKVSLFPTESEFSGYRLSCNKSLCQTVKQLSEIWTERIIFDFRFNDTIKRLRILDLGIKVKKGVKFQKIWQHFLLSCHNHYSPIFAGTQTTLNQIFFGGSSLTIEMIFMEVQILVQIKLVLCA